MTSKRSVPVSPTRRQAARHSSGCLSPFLIPPLSALMVGLLLATLAGGLSVPAEASTGPSLPVLQDTASQAGAIAALFTPEVQYWAANLIRWAGEHGLDPNLAATVMQIESCGHPDIRSSAGATGLFQVMPFHFKPGETMTNPDTNALRGLNYLRRSLERAGGNARLALAGYNGGIGVIGRQESLWPAETIRYAYWGDGIYADASQGRSESARLGEWLKAGGASLCAKARQRLGLKP